MLLHTSYLSLPPLPAVAYFFQAGVPFFPKNSKQNIKYTQQNTKDTKQNTKYVKQNTKYVKQNTNYANQNSNVNFYSKI